MRAWWWPCSFRNRDSPARARDGLKKTETIAPRRLALQMLHIGLQMLHIGGPPGVMYRMQSISHPSAM